MELNEYCIKSRRTIPNIFGDEAAANASMGLCGEIGELVDHLKKHLFHGSALDKTHVLKEIGDIMFYLNWIVIMFGLSWDDILSANFAKLTARYPNGFNENDANNRDTANEDAAVAKVL